MCFFNAGFSRTVPLAPVCTAVCGRRQSGIPAEDTVEKLNIMVSDRFGDLLAFLIRLRQEPAGLCWKLSLHSIVTMRVFAGTPQRSSERCKVFGLLGPKTLHLNNAG